MQIECKICGKEFELNSARIANCPNCGSYNVSPRKDVLHEITTCRLFPQVEQPCEECANMMRLNAKTNADPADCHPAESECRYGITPDSVELWLEREPANYFYCPWRCGE